MSHINLLEYQEIENDPTKEIVLKEEAFYGFNPTKPLNFDDRYIALHNAIASDEEFQNFQFPSLHHVHKKTLMNSASLWSELGIELHKIDTIQASVFNTKHGEMVISQKFLNAIKEVSPFQIPLTLTRDQFDGRTAFTMLSSAFDPSKRTILYSKIFISKLGDLLTSCIYNHEIAHTQLGLTNSGSSLLDIETIPILMEGIFASKLDPSLDALRQMRIIRLLELARSFYTYATVTNLSFASRIESDAYIQSTLQAIHLQNTYLEGNNTTQKEMQSFVSQVFAGKRSPQDLLDHYDAHLEQIPKTLQKLKVPSSF